MALHNWKGYVTPPCLVIYRNLVFLNPINTCAFFVFGCVWCVRKKKERKKNRKPPVEKTVGKKVTEKGQKRRVFFFAHHFPFLGNFCPSLGNGVFGPEGA